MLKSELSGSNHHGLALAGVYEKLMFETYSNEHIFHYLCTDDAGQCGRARRILALRYPFIMFHKCWAHQINLMVKALLTRYQFKSTCEQAIATAHAINASSSRILPQLKDICESFYGKKCGQCYFCGRRNSLELYSSLLCVAAPHSECM